MRPQRPELNERGKRVLALAAQILPGLLASGHFTGEDTEGDPCALGYRNDDETWRDYALSCWTTLAVDEAVSLAAQLEDACWLQCADGAEQTAYFDAVAKEHEQALAKLSQRKQEAVAAPAP
jgi:hypothetical protein